MNLLLDGIQTEARTRILYAADLYRRMAAGSELPKSPPQSDSAEC